jgi:Holliday junction resolvase-like predicted endonuclease
MKKIKGCLAENIVVCHFQLKGYYVFKASQTHGPIDLITVDPRTFRAKFYDVKTRRYRRDGSPINSVPRTKKGDIRIIYVEGDQVIEPKPHRKKSKNTEVSKTSSDE